MNIDEAWRAIDEHRLAVAALLEDLNDQEWTQASPCEGWTVRDVSAHLTLQQIGPAQALAQIVRNPGGMNRMIHAAACRRAAAPTAELIAAIRDMVSRQHNVGVSHLETLTDILVHGQDIAIPLGRSLPTRADAAARRPAGCRHGAGRSGRARSSTDSGSSRPMSSGRSAMAAWSRVRSRRSCCC